MSAKEPNYTFLQEDLDFLQSREIDARTLKVGYLKQLDTPVLQQYENIYKRAIDPAYVMCKHCRNDVMKTVQKLQDKYAAHLAANQPPADQPGEGITDPPTDPEENTGEGVTGSYTPNPQDPPPPAAETEQPKRKANAPRKNAKAAD